MRLLFLFASLLFVSARINSMTSCPGYGPVIYVDKDATGTNAGTSWANAFISLQDGLSLACGCSNVTQIWVAAATYYPDEGVGQTNNNRSSTFSLCNNIAIYGGFAGGEANLTDRSWTVNETILSGDIDQVASTTNNAYHVVTGSNKNNTSILDGFTIKSGNGNGAAPLNRGGGMYNVSGSPVINNCKFTINLAGTLGAAVYNGTSSNPVFTNCSFTSNTSSLVGGAITNEASNPSFRRCLFSLNLAAADGGVISNSVSNIILTNCSFIGNTGGSGGVINNFSSNPVITNCRFSGNKATANGGVIFNFSNSASNIINCSFTGNSAATNGGAIYNWNSPSLTIVNCIIWNNRANGSTTSTSASIFHLSAAAAISWSDIANCGGSGAGWQNVIGTDGGHNIASDPLFVTPVNPASAPTTAGDLHVNQPSPITDTGNHGATTELLDLDEVNRFVACIDMGIYEWQGEADTECPGYALLSLNIIQPCLTAGEDSLFYYPTWSENLSLQGVFEYGTFAIDPSTATWSSSNNSRATVINGKIKALTPGVVVITVQINAISKTLGIRVIAPALIPVFQSIPVSLSTPNDECAVKDMPVLIIRYMPTSDGINLDVAHASDFYETNPITISNLSQTLLDYDIRVRFALEEGSRFRDYGHHITTSYLGYRVVDIINVYEPVPRGKVSYYDTHNLPVFEVDQHGLFERFNVQHYIDDLGVKEVWLWCYAYDSGYPSYNPAIHKPCNFRFEYESNMSSPTTGDVSNSNQNPADLPIYGHTYIVYGQNLRRSQAEVIHNHGHQIERQLPYINTLQDNNTILFWQKFVGQDGSGNFITGRCGWTHMPPNTTVNYDWLNPTLVNSDIKDWKPAGGVQTQVNVNTWGNCPYIWPGANDFAQRKETQWYIYWMQSIPGNGNTIPHGANFLTNWWEAIADWDKAINTGFHLYNPTQTAYVTKNVVVSQMNTGYGTLRKTIDCAVAGSTITFSPYLYGQTYTLLTPINIIKSITVDGGSSTGTILNANSSSYGFDVSTSIVFNLKSLKLSCGQNSVQSGIRNLGLSTLHNLILEANLNTPIIQNNGTMTFTGMNSLRKL